MWTLPEGVILDLHARGGSMQNLATGEAWPLRPEDLPLVLALAAGVPEEGAESVVGLAAARTGGWAVARAQLRDPFLEQRLRALDQRFEWCRPALAPEVHALLLAAHASRRHFHRGFGQYAALPETVARRVALAGPAPRRVLVLGDDDFLALGLAAAGHEVTVLEIDPVIVGILERLAPPGRVRVLRHDLREPWPAELCGHFDQFFADPLSAPAPFRLFLARGLAGLTPGGRGHVCVSEVGQESFEAVRRALRFELVAHHSDFNHYYQPNLELAFYVSDLMLVEAGPDTLLVPAAGECFWPSEVSHEDAQPYTPASRYIIQNIDTRLAQLVHLDTAFQVLTASGQLTIASRQLHHEGEVTSYAVTTRDARVVHVRVEHRRRTAELFVSPADHELESSLLACLYGLFKVSGSFVQKHRLRNSTVARLL